MSAVSSLTRGMLRPQTEVCDLGGVVLSDAEVILA